MSARSRPFALVVASLVLLAMLPALARAQVFGQYSGARTLEPNQHLFGAYLHTSDSVLGAVGQLRLSFFPGIDFGFQGGLSRLHLEAGDRTTLRFGTDVKAALVRPGESLPFAMAIGAGLSVEASDEYSVVTLAPGAVISEDYVLGSTVNVTPYAGAAISFSRITLDGNDESDVSLPLRVGSEVELGPAARLVFEVQALLGNDLGDNWQIVTGVHFPF